MTASRPPRVSVIIPTRNSAEFLQDALDSILGQTFPHYEILIVDDQSSDRTLEILERAGDPRIRVISGPGKGLAAALNLGVREAVGEYIARMDADDIADPTRLGKQVAFLDENPEIGVCGTLFKQFMGGDAVHNHMEHVRYSDMLMGCYIGHPTAMFRRELFVVHDLYYNESMRYSEDYDLWSRAIRVTKLANIPEILLLYRRHTGSTSIAHMDHMHRLDVGVRLGMITYLVGDLTPEELAGIEVIFTTRILDTAAQVKLVTRLIGSIMHPELCSPLELLSVFHQLSPFPRAELVRMAAPYLGDVPIFIISYNHLTYLKKLVDYLERADFNNIHIIDNNSTYPPLLQYLRNSRHIVHYMGANYKHMVLFESERFRSIIDENFFVLTDPDILPDEVCPQDFLDLFLDGLLRHPMKNKVGFSLKINDLPNHYHLKENVIKWEQRFYNTRMPIGDNEAYDAPVDTTFALYRPRSQWRTSDFFAAMRTAAPYTARHLPWYADLSQPSDEDAYYRSKDEGSSNWNGTMSAEELHRKYNTGSGKTFIARPSGKAGKGLALTFRRQRIGEMRGYFFYGVWPLLNLRTQHKTEIVTTLYALGCMPIVSKAKGDRRYVFRVFGIIPIWQKAASP